MLFDVQAGLLFQLLPAQAFAVLGFSLAGICYQGYGFFRLRKPLYLGFAALTALWGIELLIRSLTYNPLFIAIAAVLHLGFASLACLIPGWMSTIWAGPRLRLAMPLRWLIGSAVGVAGLVFAWAGFWNNHHFFVLAFIPGAILNIAAAWSTLRWLRSVRFQIAPILVGAAQALHALFAAFTTASLLLESDVLALVSLVCGAIGAVLFVAGSFLIEEQKTVAEAEEAKRSEEELRYLSHHDATTGLLNRAAFFEALEGLIQNQQTEQERPCLFVIDIDHFGSLNAFVSSGAADIILQAVSERLVVLTGRHDRVYRLGGDEFAIIVDGSANELSSAMLGEEILKSFSRPFWVAGSDQYLSASIGIRFVGPAAVASEVLGQAMDALKMAKQDRNTYRFYQETKTDTGLVDTISCINQLRHAIPRGEFRLLFQPQVDELGVLVGAEALLRWLSPVLGEVPPSVFIPIAEDSGLITAIGEWVIEEACAELASWNKIGIDLPLAVNLSARQLRDHRLERILQQKTRKYGIRPEQLHLEITETSVFESTDDAMSILWNLRRQGFHFCIDDFGTGYASLSYLKLLPVHTVKIDKSFIGGLPADPQDTAVVSAVMSIARGLGLRVVAEGVESAHQAEFLHSQQCTVHQGYLYSHPLESATFRTTARPAAS